MKRLVFAILGLVLLSPVMAAGCAAPPQPPPGEEVSSCVICHTDKDLLKQTASAPKEEKSEATSGEG